MSLCCLRLRRYPSRLPHYLPVFLRETSCVFEVRSWDASTCLAASTCLDVLAGAVEGPPRSLSLPPRRGQRVAPTQLRPEHLVAARWRPRVRAAPNMLYMYTCNMTSESVSTVICTKQLCVFISPSTTDTTHTAPDYTRVYLAALASPPPRPTALLSAADGAPRPRVSDQMIAALPRSPRTGRRPPAARAGVARGGRAPGRRPLPYML